MKERLNMKQIKPLLKGFILLVVVSLLLACSSDSDNPSPIDPAPQPGPEPEPVVEGARGNIEVSEALRDGSTWKTDCSPSENGSIMQSWSFTLTDFITKFNYYTDSSCKSKDSEKSSDFSGTYEVGSNEIKSPEGYKAYELDIVFSDEGSLEGLVALSEDKEKTLISIDKTRPSDFSRAFEYSKGGGEESEETPKDLEGRWGTSCKELDGGKSAYFGYSFKKNKFTEVIIVYSDPNCKTEDQKGEFVGESIKGKSVTTDDGFAATELNLNFDNGDVEKRLYSNFETKSGQDGLFVSRTKEDGSMPTTLEPGINYVKIDDSKRSAMSSSEESGYPGNIEIQGSVLSPELTLEFNKLNKLKQDTDRSRSMSRDLSQKFQERQNLMPNQEGLRSGSW